MPNDNPQGGPKIERNHTQYSPKAKPLNDEEELNLILGVEGAVREESLNVCLFSEDHPNSKVDSLESWFKNQKDLKVTESDGLIAVHTPDTNEKICEYKKPGIANFAYPKGRDLLEAFFGANTGKEFTVNKCSSIAAAMKLAQLAKDNDVKIIFKPEILAQLEKIDKDIKQELAKILGVADTDLVSKTAHKRPGT